MSDRQANLVESSSDQWRVTYDQDEVGSRYWDCPTEKAAREMARAISRYDYMHNVRIWRREVGPWLPKCQSEFPGEAGA